MSSGLIPRRFIDELLVRVDIVDLIDSHLPLKKTGSNYIACCPFHTEKTPSFSVSRKRQLFHCFGCGASGNAISFLMDFNHLNFVEAVEDLAAFIGIDVPRDANASQESAKPNLTPLFAIMEQVAVFYEQQLRSTEQGKKAADYLKNRGVSSDIARQFMLGYAPDEWHAFANQFNQQSFLDAGMLVETAEGKVYDRFRGRLMFPIRDKRARIVGFGGRVLDDSLPKYLNSPETPLFHKGKEVYGLYELLKKQPKPARILVVEGYMDVIALAQFGLHYAVAALGTALSQAHLDLLFRFSQELVFCFDGDKAGRAAAWRAMDVVFPCLRDGRTCRIMLLPAQHDPDSLIREEGLDCFIERIETAQVLSDYFFGRFAGELDLAKIEGRAQLVNRAKNYLEKLPNGIFRGMMLDRLKELSGIATLDILQKKTLPSTNESYQEAQEYYPILVKRTLSLLIQNPEWVDLIEQKQIDWQSVKFTGIDKFKDILHIIQKNKPARTGQLLEYYRGHKDENLIKAFASLTSLTPVGNDVFNEKIEFQDTLNKLFEPLNRRSVLFAKLKSGDITPEERTELQALSNTRNK